MNVTDKEAIFLSELKEHKRDTHSMVKMRKAIPLLLKILYNIKEDTTQKKGIWKIVEIMTACLFLVYQRN